MTPERWQQVKAIFQSALEREPQERALFLAQACVDDPQLKSEVEALLSSYKEAGDEQADGSLETVVTAMAEQMFGGQPAAPAVGQRIGHYELIRQIGAGGMGEVYLAQDSQLARKVALKLLPSHVVQDRQRLERFKQEARAASALNHPNILTIYEIGEEAGQPFIATEFIEGETLRARLAHAHLPLGEALEVAVQVATGLNAAHEAGIVHRDIKPENLMLRRDGYVKILDFGLAKLIKPQADSQENSIQVKTDEGVVLGTPRYMSPEQARGEKVDGRTDIFSLGAVLYEMLARHAPFEGTTLGEVIVAILEREPPPMSHYTEGIPAELDWVVKKALRKEQEGRYPSIKDLLNDLREIKQELEYRARHARSPAAEAEGVATLAEVALRTAPTETAHSTSRAEYVIDQIKQHRRGAAVALFALTLAVASLIYLFSLANPSQAIDSIAVLPLANKSIDPNTDYLSDGITESLINSLSQLSKLRVMARTTAFRYKGKEVDPRVVGRELGVRAVLTGSLRQHGDQLTIQVDLVETADGAQVWGEQYNRKPSDLLAVQVELSRDISEKLRLRLSTEDKQRLTKHHTENIKAYQYYMQGRSYSTRRTREDLQTGMRYYLKAIMEDRNYALAYAGLADSYTNLGVRGYIPPIEGHRKTEEAARQALALDDNLAEAHVALGLGYTAFAPYNFALSDLELRRAIELSPSSATAHQNLGLSLLRQGRLDEGLKELVKARELDPLSSITARQVALHYYLKRDYGRALEVLKQANELGPNLVTTWEIGVYLQNRLFDETLAELERERQVRKNDPLLIYDTGMVYAAQGRRPEARRIIQELEEMSGTSLSQAHWIAKICAILNEQELALQWLERGLGAGALGVFYKDDPVWDKIRSDLRFADLPRRMGIPQ